MKNVKSLKGKRFGRLVSLGEYEKKNEKIYEKCLCDCGNIIRTQRSGLGSGRTTSCGCLWEERFINRVYKHGMASNRIYRIYWGAKVRCQNKNSAGYKHYGGRGIKFMRDTFEDFYRDMGASYEDHVRLYGEDDTTIDRIDVDGNYCKENCRWATHKEQMSNTRCSYRWMYKYKNLKQYLSDNYPQIVIPSDM